MADDDRADEPSPEAPGADDAPTTADTAPVPATAAPATPAPAMPPPAAAAAAPGPRRRRRWLPVFLVIIGAIVVLWIVGGVLFATRTLPPYQAADEFVDDLADNRFQAAASRLCDADSDDPDAAITSVTRHFVARDNVAVNPFGVARDGDTATVDYTVSSDDDDVDSDTFELRVIEEDGEWKPCPNVSAR